ncbi:MAG: SEL1-like repeat protein [Alphaproteobacteria bacterium]|nr:SEL1-like repeat protein [Alphaproteobacteria bacterium]
MADVFISYARDDRARVEQLAKALEQRGFSVWWDPELLPGETYAQKIQTVLASVKAVIVVWSKTSAARPWVLDEAAVGRDRGVLIPVLIDSVEAPLGFRQLQAEDLSHWPSAASEESFNRVVRAIEAISGREATPPPKPTGLQFPPQAKRALETVEKRASNLPRLIGGGLLAVLLIAGAYQIFKPADPNAPTPTTEEPTGGTADAASAYGLSTKQIASLDFKPMIDAALQTSNIDLIRKGAEDGDALGQTLLCLAYDAGEGVTADAVQARTWCERAAGQGSTIATYLLSFYQRNGVGGFTADAAEANRLLEEAANAGDARAQYDLGVCFLNGVYGYTPDDSLAISWTRKAAEQAYQKAQFNLAWMYENGRAVQKDYATAVLWYQKLADEGSAVGTRGLGWMYYNGWGVEQDYAKAAEYYRTASEAGDGNASNNLAALYENGYGVEKSLDEAVKYYRLAVDQGFPRAKEELKRLGFSD